jgi:hypothetical protein
MFFYAQMTLYRQSKGFDAFACPQKGFGMTKSWLHSVKIINEGFPA